MIFVGQVVDYYPDSHTRLPAIVLNTRPAINPPSVRPEVDLQVFKPDGTLQYCKSVQPTTPSFDDELPTLEKRWALAHEFSLAQVDDDDPDFDADSVSVEGIHTNEFVGSIAHPDLL